MIRNKFGGKKTVGRTNQRIINDDDRALLLGDKDVQAQRKQALKYTSDFSSDLIVEWKSRTNVDAMMEKALSPPQMKNL